MSGCPNASAVLSFMPTLLFPEKFFILFPSLANCISTQYASGCNHGAVEACHLFIPPLTVMYLSEECQIKFRLFQVAPHVR